jgi:hypothetical protein
MTTIQTVEEKPAEHPPVKNPEPDKKPEEEAAK